MSANTLRVAGAALLYVLISAFGFWLSRLGKPYNSALINVHKLLALAAVVLFVITLVQFNRAARLGPAALIAGVVTVLLAAGLFATGALLSIDKPMPAIVTRLHHLAPYLAVLSTAVTLYLLLKRP